MKKAMKEQLALKKVNKKVPNKVKQKAKIRKRKANKMVKISHLNRVQKIQFIVQKVQLKEELIVIQMMNRICERIRKRKFVISCILRLFILII